MNLDWEPRDRSGRWGRRLALAILVGSVLALLDLGLFAASKLFARMFK